jgi:hypothetical protein
VAGHDGGPVGGVPITLKIWQNHASRLDIRYFCIIILIYHDCDFKKMRIQRLLNRVEKIVK